MINTNWIYINNKLKPTLKDKTLVMYTITGKIIVKETGKPVADVIVRLMTKSTALKQSATTTHSIVSVLSDALGNFKLSADPTSFEKLSKDQAFDIF